MDTYVVVWSSFFRINRVTTNGVIKCYVMKRKRESISLQLVAVKKNTLIYVAEFFFKVVRKTVEFDLFYVIH